jgi:hypothetical protein
MNEDLPQDAMEEEEAALADMAWEAFNTGWPPRGKDPVAALYYRYFRMTRLAARRLRDSVQAIRSAAEDRRDFLYQARYGLDLNFFLIALFAVCDGVSQTQSKGTQDPRVDR